MKDSFLFIIFLIFLSFFLHHTYVNKKTTVLLLGMCDFSFNWGGIHELQLASYGHETIPIAQDVLVQTLLWLLFTNAGAACAMAGIYSQPTPRLGTNTVTTQQYISHKISQCYEIIKKTSNN